MPRRYLQLEGAVALVAATAIYFRLGYVWWIYLLLLFAPDLSAIGYAGGPRLGSVCYNLAHNLIFPVILLVVAWWVAWSTGLQVALIWIAHIGLDRMIGYGLKYPEAFKQSHLDRV